MVLASFAMPTASLCGLKPLLFGRKTYKLLKGVHRSKSKKKLRQGSKMDRPRGSAGNFILMMDLKKKIITFRDVIDLPPHEGSSNITELVIGTMKALRKYYPEIITSSRLSEMKGASINKVLLYFCEVLRSLGDSWMMNNDWMDKVTLNMYSNHEQYNSERIVEIALATLNCMIKIPKETLDVMDEDDQKYSPPASAFGKYSVEPYSENSTSCCPSPVTPTSVLPLFLGSPSSEEFNNLSKSSPHIQSLRVQAVLAVGKLNPIDIKRLSFHMPSGAEHQHHSTIQSNKREDDIMAEMEAKSKFLDQRSSVEEELMFELEASSNSEVTKAHDFENINFVSSIATPESAKEIHETTVTSHINEVVQLTQSHPPPPPPPLPHKLKAQQPQLQPTLPPTMLEEAVVTPFTPPMPTPLPTTTLHKNVETVRAPSPPPTPTTSRTLSAIPPPCAPPLPQTSTTTVAASPPPSLPQKSVDATTALPPPPPPPPNKSTTAPAPPQTSISAAATPPPPPPPIMSSKGPMLPPPPITSSKGPMSPPPPPPPIISSKGPTSPPPPAPPIMSSKGPKSLPPPPPIPFGNGSSLPSSPTGAARSLRPKKAQTKLKRSSQMGNLYRILKGKVEGGNQNTISSNRRKGSSQSSACGKQSMADALAEMTKRSAYFQQIEEDVQTYSNSIMQLKTAISTFQTKDMTELMKFHEHIESVLEKLTDETQVLARFEGFPQNKLEALRMAAALYSKLNGVVTELHNWKIEAPLGKLLERTERYFNKIKGEMETLERTKDEEAKKFQHHNIHFDFHILVEIKEAMVDVSSNCMELALKERKEAKAAEDGTKTERKKACSKVLWKAFQFAFRVYNFAGGHDERADKLTRELAQEIETDPLQE